MSDDELEMKIIRVLAWLQRNEQVSPAAIERAVTNARNMQRGQMTSLTGPTEEAETLRRVFSTEQAWRLLR